MKHPVLSLSGQELDIAVAIALNIQWQIIEGKVFGFDNPCGYPGACPGWYEIDTDLCSLIGARSTDQRRQYVIDQLGEEIEL